MLKREKKRANAAAAKLSEVGVELEFDPRTDEAEAFAATSSSSRGVSSFSNAAATSSSRPPIGNGRPPTGQSSKGRPPLKTPSVAAASAADDLTLNDSAAGAANPFAKNKPQSDPANQAAKKACMPVACDYCLLIHTRLYISCSTYNFEYSTFEYVQSTINFLSMSSSNDSKERKMDRNHNTLMIYFSQKPVGREAGGVRHFQARQPARAAGARRRRAQPPTPAHALHRREAARHRTRGRALTNRYYSHIYDTIIWYHIWCAITYNSVHCAT